MVMSSGERLYMFPGRFPVNQALSQMQKNDNGQVLFFFIIISVYNFAEIRAWPCLYLIGH